MSRERIGRRTPQIAPGRRERFAARFRSFSMSCLEDSFDALFMVIQATQARLTETARKALKVREEHCPDPWLSGSSRSAVSGSAPIDSIPQVMSQFGLPLKNRLRSARLSSPTIAVSACSLWSQAASGRVRGRRSGVAWRKVDIFKGLLQKIGFVRRGSIPLFSLFSAGFNDRMPQNSSNKSGGECLMKPGDILKTPRKRESKRSTRNLDLFRRRITDNQSF